MSLPRLIGIAGRAGVGKDTLANQLVGLHGYVRYALADPIKRLLNERFGWAMSDWDNRVWKETSDGKYGWNETTCVPFSPRSWAQWLGTEVGRTLAGEDIWASLMREEYSRLCLRSPATAAMVVPDVRFANEARMIHQLGGIVVEIRRQGVEPVAAHVSENGVPVHLVDDIIWNDGTPADLLNRLKETVE